MSYLCGFKVTVTGAGGTGGSGMDAIRRVGEKELEIEPQHNLYLFFIRFGWSPQLMDTKISRGIFISVETGSDGTLH